MTKNDRVKSEYVVAYLADVTSGLGSPRRSTGLLSALRGYADSHADRWLVHSRAWLRPGNSLEADTRQIRNYGRSRTPGACEVRLGLRLAT